MNYEKNRFEGRYRCPLGCDMESPINNMQCGLYQGLPIAMVYGISQQFKDVYEADKGLQAGTLFAELNLPFMSNQGGKKC